MPALTLNRRVRIRAHPTWPNYSEWPEEYKISDDEYNARSIFEAQCMSRALSDSVVSTEYYDLQAESRFRAECANQTVMALSRAWRLVDRWLDEWMADVMESHSLPSLVIEKMQGFLGRAFGHMLLADHRGHLFPPGNVGMCDMDGVPYSHYHQLIFSNSHYH